MNTKTVNDQIKSQRDQGNLVIFAKSPLSVTHLLPEYVKKPHLALFTEVRAFLKENCEKTSAYEAAYEKKTVMV